MLTGCNLFWFFTCNFMRSINVWYYDPDDRLYLFWYGTWVGFYQFQLISINFGIWFWWPVAFILAVYMWAENVTSKQFTFIFRFPHTYVRRSHGVPPRAWGGHLDKLDFLFLKFMKDAVRKCRDGFPLTWARDLVPWTPPALGRDGFFLLLHFCS